MRIEFYSDDFKYSGKAKEARCKKMSLISQELTDEQVQQLALLENETIIKVILETV